MKTSLIKEIIVTARNSPMVVRLCAMPNRIATWAASLEDGGPPMFIGRLRQATKNEWVATATGANCGDSDNDAADIESFTNPAAAARWLRLTEMEKRRREARGEAE